MKHEDVAPHIRHLVEVYVGTDNDPAYRGTLLWQMDDTSVVVHSGAPGEEYRQTTEPVLIADIRKIDPRGDPLASRLKQVWRENQRKRDPLTGARRGHGLKASAARVPTLVRRRAVEKPPYASRKARPTPGRGGFARP